MIDKINPALAGFDEAVLERWGLKPSAKDTLTRAKQRGAITPQEISEMISSALVKDRQKMAEVLRELKNVLQNLNITVTFNVVHTHIVETVPPVVPATAPESRVKLKKSWAPQQPENTESPFLNARILEEHGLLPEALNILLAAQEKGQISPGEIGALIPTSISKDNEKLRPIMRWITQLLGTINVRIVIGSVHVKKPESKSPTTSYSVRPKKVDEHEKPSEVKVESSGESSDLGEVGQFVPTFIFDKEDSSELNPYYRTARNIPLLKIDEVMGLSRKFQASKKVGEGQDAVIKHNGHGITVNESWDYDARNTIVVHNLRLAMKWAEKYQGRGLDYDDLVQEGNIGLMVAAERYDPEKGFHFSTYATWWLRQNITRAIQNYRDIIRMPVHASEALNKILKITCELGMELQREPLLEEVAARAELGISEVKKILHQLKVPVVSLEELVYASSDDGDDRTIGDTVIDECFLSPSAALEAKDELEVVSKNIRTLLATVKALPLSEDSKTSFKMYYGLDRHREDNTFDSVMITTGSKVTRQAIQQRIERVWQDLAKYGMTKEKLLANLKRVHDLENIVCAETDLSTPTEDIILEEVQIVFQDQNQSGGETPGVTITPIRRKANLVEVKPGTPTPEDIIRVVSEAYGKTPEMVTGDAKPDDLVWIRWVCAYIMREELKSSFMGIAHTLHYKEHTAVMYGYRSLKKAIERDPALKDEIEKITALCGFRQSEQADPKPGSAEATTLSPIVEQVFELSCQIFGVERSNLFQKFVKSIDPEVVQAKLTRNVVIYLLHEDFGVQIKEITRIFDFGHYSTVCSIYADMVAQAKTDTGLQTKLTTIRSLYGLGVYGSDFEMLEKCQKVLFPKQAEELKDIAEKAKSSFQKRVRGLHTKVESIEVPERHKERFRARYSGDLSREVPSYESLAKPPDLTRARIEQMVNGIWAQLDPFLEPTDIRTSDEYVRELEKVCLLVELLKR